MIQIITKDSYMYQKQFTNKEIIISSFSDYNSFDLYDINIINLCSNNLWESNSTHGEYLNDKTDLITIKNAIKTSNAKVLIFFPQNHYFRYDYYRTEKKFKYAQQLKSIQDKINKFISEYIYEPLPRFDYEKGITKIDGEIYNSDFYFNENKGLILCEKSKKNNTMNLSDRIVITTSNIFETPVNKEVEKRLYVFLNKIGFLTQNEMAPEWINNIKFYDDFLYQDNIDKCMDEINKLNAIINENQEKINNNLAYKSILYSSGNSLSNQINDMLKEIFDLADSFEDVYEEDFKFKLAGITFIIETEGLTNEVSGKNVSDAYNHLVIYDDKLEQDNIEEETKCLFFVATERFKEPTLRNKINNRQITLAKRNRTLIIETTTFYKIFEDFKKDKISSNEILELFKQNVGVLEYTN